MCLACDWAKHLESRHQDPAANLQFDTREEMLAALEAYRDADPEMDVVRGSG